MSSPAAAAPSFGKPNDKNTQAAHPANPRSTPRTSAPKTPSAFVTAPKISASPTRNNLLPFSTTTKAALTGANQPPAKARNTSLSARTLSVNPSNTFANSPFTTSRGRLTPLTSSLMSSVASFTSASSEIPSWFPVKYSASLYRHSMPPVTALLRRNTVPPISLSFCAI